MFILPAILYVGGYYVDFHAIFTRCGGLLCHCSERLQEMALSAPVRHPIVRPCQLLHVDNRSGFSLAVIESGLRKCLLSTHCFSRIAIRRDDDACRICLVMHRPFIRLSPWKTNEQQEGKTVTHLRFIPQVSLIAKRGLNNTVVAMSSIITPITRPLNKRWDLTCL